MQRLDLTSLLHYEQLPNLLKIQLRHAMLCL